MTIEVWRGGALSAYESKVDAYVTTTVQDGTVRVHFTIPSKGGGETGVSVRLTAASFAEIAKLMAKANHAAAMHAFTSALK